LDRPGEDGALAGLLDAALAETRGGGGEPWPQSPALARLSGYVAARGGALRLIDFSPLKASRPDFWPAANTEIHEFIAAVAARDLRHGDRFVRLDDATYLLVMAQASEMGIHHVATKVAEGVTRELVGRHVLLDFASVHSMSGDAEGESLFRLVSQEEETLDEFLLRVRTLTRINREWRFPREARIDDEDAPDTDIEFIFRPLLALRDRTMSTFLFMPLRPMGDGYISGYAVLDDPGDPSETCRLDVMTLRHAIGAIDDIMEKGARTLIGLQVHALTLGHSGTRNAYRKALASLTSDQISRIVFELAGVPDDVETAELEAVAAALRPTAGLVNVQARLGTGNFQSFRAAGFRAVGIDVYSSGAAEAEVMQGIDDFIEGARRHQLKTYILGVRSVSLYTAAVTAGFDYMSGHALSEAFSAPTEVVAYRLDQPFTHYSTRSKN